ncbi:RacP protein OS=Streptomyces fumanus OX=67302 GN=GCM10018772_61450 PE=4 SV=1 [Streptomyces fumanus]
MITGTLDPHLARYPDDEWAQLASAQLTGVRATLAQLTK